MSLIKPSTPREAIATAGAGIALIMTLWSGLVKAVDYEASIVKKPELQAIVSQTQSSIDSMEKRQLSSKIFELDLIDKPSKAQKAMRNKLQNDLDELNKRSK